VIEAPLGLAPSTLTMAANYLNRHLAGRRLAEAQKEIEDEIRQRRAELDELTAKLVQAGLAIWAGPPGGPGSGAQLLIRGQSHLLEDVTALADIERVRRIFDALETEETTARLLDAAAGAEGVQIFIGSESQLFAHSGCSVIVAPYRNGREQVIGALGVIGPLRMNYARIIPMVDYTAKLVGRLLK
jgi:heat-inducible transcriptional repressor